MFYLNGPKTYTLRTVVNGNIKAKWFYSGIIQPRIDFVFLENSPVSFYIGTGYFYYTNRISGRIGPYSLDRTIQGIKLEGAIMVYL